MVNAFFHYVFYGIGLMCILKGLDIRLFSPEFWYIGVGFALFSASHDFRFAKIED